MNKILIDIIKAKKHRIEKAKHGLTLEEIKKKAVVVKYKSKFLKALSDKAKTNIIAEIKKASPSRGIICEDFNPAKIAKSYTDSKAKAISVLTEEDYFLGKPEYIKQVKKVTKLPVLRKDFIIDPYQIYESRMFKADAVLLISSILEFNTLSRFYALCCRLGIDALVEVHTKEDLNKALRINCKIIGINNRNLNDFSVNVDNGFKLLPLIPKNKVVVIESGINNHQDIKKYLKRDVNSFLIGETLMRTENITRKIEELIYG